MNSGNNQEKKSRPPFFRKKGQPAVPWPNDLRLRLMGKTGIVIGVIFLLFLTGLVSSELSNPHISFGLQELMSFLSLSIFGVLYIAVGIVAMRCGKTKSKGSRRALKALCAVMILCSVVLCAILFEVRKDILVSGLPGFILAFPLLTLEKGMK